MGDSLHMVTETSGHGSVVSAERLQSPLQVGLEGSILTTHLSPFYESGFMAAFPSSVGTPLRPDLSIVCSVLLQECPREHLRSTPSVTSSGGMREHPALEVTSGPLACDVQGPLVGALQERRWVPGPRGQPAAPEPGPSLHTSALSCGGGFAEHTQRI